MASDTDEPFWFALLLIIPALLWLLFHPRVVWGLLRDAVIRAYRKVPLV